MAKRTSRKSASQSTPARPVAVARGKRVLRLPEVIAKIGLSRATIYKMQEKGQFPASLKIGKSAVAWREDELDRWLSKRLRYESRAGVAAE